MNTRKQNDKQNRSAALSCNGSGMNLLLSRYQDNELDAPMQERVHFHLQRCEACRAELADLESLTSHMKQLPQVDTEDNFNALLMAKINQTQPVHSWWELRTLVPSFLYSLVVIACVALGVLVSGFQVEPTIEVPQLIETQPLAQNQPSVQDMQITQLLTQSRELSLMNVQDDAVALFAHLGTGSNGVNHDK